MKFFRSRTGMVICLALIAVPFGLVVLFGPFVNVSVTRNVELVKRPPDPTIDLIKSGASLSEIQSTRRAARDQLGPYCAFPGELLVHAAANDRTDVAAWLLENEADPNGVSSLNTPLYIAVKRKSHPMIHLLLEYGADPTHGSDMHLAPRLMIMLPEYEAERAVFEDVLGEEYFEVGSSRESPP